MHIAEAHDTIAWRVARTGVRRGEPARPRGATRLGLGRSRWHAVARVAGEHVPVRLVHALVASHRTTTRSVAPLVESVVARSHALLGRCVHIAVLVPCRAPVLAERRRFGEQWAAGRAPTIRGHGRWRGRDTSRWRGWRMWGGRRHDGLTGGRWRRWRWSGVQSCIRATVRGGARPGWWQLVCVDNRAPLIV